MSSHNKKSFNQHIPKWFKNLNLSTLIISMLVFIVLSFAVLGMPKPEAHFYNTDPIDLMAGGAFQVDVGLFDKWFFQWHRPHIKIVIGVLNLIDGEMEAFDVSSTQNGLYLNPYPLFLTILSCLTLGLCITNICFNFKFQWNKKCSYNFAVNIIITILIFAVLSMGLIFYFGDIVEKFMNISLDVKKVDGDFNWLINYQIQHPNSNGDLAQLITEYDMQSVVVSYSTVAVVCVTLVSICGGGAGILCGIDIVNYFKPVLLKKQN